jgi:hypothetical protein
MRPVKFPRSRLAAALLALLAGAALSWAAHATTAQPEPAGATAFHGMKRGTDAAGNAIQHADDATRRGVHNVSERASAGPRHVGEAFGRKLVPGSSGKPKPPAIGPQGTAP